ncbi:ABC multidrug transporter [Colletotrichum kahawae]|uniref:ABC multidrug transporter n=1 Tax=Colletotrichum kahawae TaxID=34407 RepID=A0AAD9YBY4_COLKA|nr:ABC multidrug transporter [Colletotrichum kahawae]
MFGSRLSDESEATLEETQDFLPNDKDGTSPSSARRQKTKGFGFFFWVIMCFNAILFPLSVACAVSAFRWKYTLQHKHGNALLRLTSWYSPVFDQTQIGIVDKRVNGSILNLDNSIFRRAPSPEVDEAWERISSLMPHHCHALSIARFAAYIGVNDDDSDLDSATMFSPLVLIALLGAPLIHLFQAMPALGSALGGFGRIHAFLETPKMFQNANFDVQPKQMHQGDTKLHSNPSGRNQVAISIRNASLGWSSEETVLENINLEVTRGSFVALVGKTGSGKSLLLKSAVGEAGHVSDSIELPLDEIAYCSQTPWLENMSAEQTRTQYGGSDQNWLAEVLEACFLDDLISLPDYRTGQVSSGGVRLSGGQRQRLGAKDEQDEKDTMVSDRQVYLRYARAMGFKNAGIFLFLVIAFAICLKLPVPTSASTLHASLLRTVLLAPFAFIGRDDTGSLMNRFNQDLMFVDALLPLDLFNTCAELFTSTFQLILVAVISKKALAVLPVLSATLYFIQRIYLRSSKQLRLLDISWKADIHTKFGETASGLSVIRANGWLNPMREKFMEKLDRSQEPFYLLYMVQRWLQLVLNLVVAGLAITIAGVAIGMRDKVAAGAVGVEFLNTTTLGETLTNFIISWTSLETSLGAIARVSMFERDTPREREEQSSVDVPDNWPTPGQVTFENVWAAYDDRDGGSNWRLSGITLIVKPGERVAVYGRTGSGKSTLLLALLGMLHMPVGSVRVDGIDVSALQMTILRRRFKVVSQDSFFEPTSTFRQDLDPSGGISDVDIEEILKECRVWEVVAASGGFDGKRADTKLSAGEAQLFGFLLRSLDRETEVHTKTVMSARLQNATVIAVMHRLEAVATYDKFAVLDKGALIDSGDVADFKARCELFK